MNIYVDESGSINNHDERMPHFVIALVCVKDNKRLKRAYSRFVSTNLKELKRLDKEGRMFDGDKFKELKGSQFDKPMKQKFVEFFSSSKLFEVLYIRLDNLRLSDSFCKNTARCFNYSMRLALQYFMKKGILPVEDHLMQLDERNEKTETKFFLENYLNTEIPLEGGFECKFRVEYFDSCDNSLIQIADVFANLYYSHLKTRSYSEEFRKLGERGIFKKTFVFPCSQNSKRC